MNRKWLLAFLLAATPAAAHDWYPLECCHNQDCAPVERTEFVPANPAASLPGTSAHANVPQTMIVTTKYGTVVVPPNFVRRDSEDHKMHACMMPGAEGKMQLICIFMPPSM